MNTEPTSISAGASESWAVFETAQGQETRAGILRLTRHLVVFELYSPVVPLHMSEALNRFQITVGERVLFSGRAVVTNLVNTGTATVCEATLDDSWIDLDFASQHNLRSRLQNDFQSFLEATQKTFHVTAAFKLAVADLQYFLGELRRWLEQVELWIRSEPDGNRQQIERTILNELREFVLSHLGSLFQRFEETCGEADQFQRPMFAYYAKKQLHPLVLCAPFMYRTFQKPLGYAGDYEMVNMMVRDPFEGGSLFAKILNAFFLSTPPVQAHRNRIVYLKRLLTEETARVMQENRPIAIFNLGCGPAKEIQEFLAEQEIASKAQFTLVDFNEETIAYTSSVLQAIQAQTRRSAQLQFQKKSVMQLLKDASKPGSNLSLARYDLVYCAGLFDYLPNNVCQKLMSLFYQMLAPGGLLVATNVDISNPSRNWMECSVDWHLFYRDYKEMAALIPPEASLDLAAIRAEGSGVNIFVEIRKPSHG
jgi:extracellular factor (EF) 3-hydroxypalmitic acid methyl ester biosynthesis protein